MVPYPKDPKRSRPATSKSLPVTKILDLRFDVGKQFLVQLLNTDEPQWVRHRLLQHVPDLVAAFMQKRTAEQENVVHRPDRIPDLIFGHTRRPEGEMQLLVKWRDMPLCDLVQSRQMSTMHPAMVLAYYLRRFELNPKSKQQQRQIAESASSAALMADMMSTGDGDPFDRFGDPEKLERVYYDRNGIWYLMRWLNGKRAVVSANDAHDVCPQIVIDYFESCV